jgi:hypothetical protein
MKALKNPIIFNLRGLVRAKSLDLFFTYENKGEAKWIIAKQLKLAILVYNVVKYWLSVRVKRQEGI